MALWMAYAAAVSLLLAGAALAAEKGLELYRKPTRWPWIAALAGSVVVPVLAYAASTGWIDVAAGGAAGAAGAEGGAAGILPGPFRGAELSAGAAGGAVEALRSLDPWLLGGCAAASLGMAAWIVGGWLRLRTERREWRSVTVDDVEVLISPDEGPAVTGFVRGTILLPAWFEELDRELQRLVLRHEREHLSSGDHRLFSLGLAAVVLLPWNPVAWWCLSRLRQAMEIDCDRRVVARGVSPADYGELLVQAGRRASGSLLAPASFAASEPLLERRVKSLASPVPEGRGSRAVLAVGTVFALAAAGGWLPAPDDTVRVAGGDDDVVRAAATDDAAARERPRRDANRADRPEVIPPVPGAVRLDPRLFLKRGGAGGGAQAREGGLDIEAIRIARRLSFACGPYLARSARTGGVAKGERPDDEAAPGGPGCLVVMDGRRVPPTALRELAPGSIERINMLPADEATERFGPDGREGAFLIRTRKG